MKGKLKKRQKKTRNEGKNQSKLSDKEKRGKGREIRKKIEMGKLKGK